MAAAAAAPANPGEQLQPDDLRVRTRRRSASASPSASDDEAAEPPPPPQQQQFSQLSQLLRPTAAEHPLLRCQLEQCQFQTHSRAELDAHARSHANRRCYECDVCHMRFTNGANLRRHRMRHTGIKPYECRFCSKRFFRRDHLLEHMSTHAKAAGRRLPWQCPVCAKGFQRQIAMRAHYQNEHVRDADWSRTCKLCGFSADCSRTLQAHLAERHGLQLGSVPTAPLLLPHHFLAPVQLSVDGESPPHSPRPSQQSPNSSQASPNSSGQVSPTGCRSAPPQLSAEPPPPAPAEARLQAQQPVPAPLSAPPVSVSVKPEPAEEAPLTPDTDSCRLQAEDGRQLEQQLPATDGDSRLLLTQAPPAPSPAPGGDTPADGGGGADRDSGGSRLRSLLQQRRPALSALLQPRRAHLCSLCGILFPDQTLYFLHKGCHAENNPWKCNICSEVCHNVYEFNSHLLSQPHQ